MTTGAKRLGLQAEHLAASSAEVKSDGSFSAALAVCRHGMNREVPIHGFVNVR
jgi:hypothetical protein